MVTFDYSLPFIRGVLKNLKYLSKVSYCLSIYLFWLWSISQIASFKTSYLDSLLTCTADHELLQVRCFLHGSGSNAGNVLVPEVPSLGL